MALKFAVLVVALVLAWFLLIRPLSALSRPGRTPPPAPAALEPCARCGVYRPHDRPCNCTP